MNMKNKLLIGAVSVGLVFAGSTALAGHSATTKMVPKVQSYTLDNLELVSVNPTVSNKLCQSLDGKSYQFNSTQKMMKIGNMTITNMKYKVWGKKSHSMYSMKWTGDWVYMGKDKKTYKGKVYGKQLFVKGLKISYGSFSNGHCAGFYSYTMK